MLIFKSQLLPLLNGCSNRPTAHVYHLTQVCSPQNSVNLLLEETKMEEQKSAEVWEVLLLSPSAGYG